MILYKYVPFKAGIKILKSNSVGFSRPSDFNDPFEVEAAYPTSEKPNSYHGMSYEVRTLIKKEIWKSQTGILSLTRTPLNPLMWAHYADEHKGMVIGIDVSTPLFTCENSNLIPVQYGNVIYTTEKPDTQFLSKPKESIRVGETFNFHPENLERLQRLFLYKPSCWGYEEEVRVVKCLNGTKETLKIKSGIFNKIEVKNRDLYLTKLPLNTIKEVYLGVRAHFPNALSIEQRVGEIKQLQPQAKVLGCKISDTSWQLTSSELEYNF